MRRLPCTVGCSCFLLLAAGQGHLAGSDEVQILGEGQQRQLGCATGRGIVRVIPAEATRDRRGAPGLQLVMRNTSGYLVTRMSEPCELWLALAHSEIAGFVTETCWPVQTTAPGDTVTIELLCRAAEPAVL